MVADIEELNKLDASEIHSRRPNAQEVTTPKNGENFVFPIADGTVKMSEGDQGIRKSTFIQDQPERSEELRNDLRRDSDGSQPTDTTNGRLRSPRRLLVDRRELHLPSSR